jgi:hypothetical protein
MELDISFDDDGLRELYDFFDKEDGKIDSDMNTSTSPHLIADTSQSEIKDPETPTPTYSIEDIFSSNHSLLETPVYPIPDKHELRHSTYYIKTETVKETKTLDKSSKRKLELKFIDWDKQSVTRIKGTRERSSRGRNPPSGCNIRSICEIDTEGKIINEWDSMRIACRDLHIKNNVMFKACSKGIHINDRIFCYKDSLPNPEFPNEIWKPIPYPHIKPLQVSNYGRVRNNRNRILKNKYRNKRFYVNTRSINTNKTLEHTIDRLVAAAFLGKNKSKVIHKDGDLGNNKVENLRYVRK